MLTCAAIHILRIPYDGGGDAALISSVTAELRQDSTDWHRPSFLHNCKDANEPSMRLHLAGA